MGQNFVAFSEYLNFMINMEAISKFDTKSVIKSDIKFDISTKLTTWIGHERGPPPPTQLLNGP